MRWPWELFTSCSLYIWVVALPIASLSPSPQWALQQAFQSGSDFSYRAESNHTTSMVESIANSIASVLPDVKVRLEGVFLISLTL